jgi:hypothetical protein
MACSILLPFRFDYLLFARVCAPLLVSGVYRFVMPAQKKASTSSQSGSNGCAHPGIARGGTNKPSHGGTADAAR